MKKELENNDYIEITLHAGEYKKSISGNAEELELVGFPIGWINEAPTDVESESLVVSDFISQCAEEFSESYGSGKEFWESWGVDLKVTLNDGMILEGRG